MGCCDPTRDGAGSTPTCDRPASRSQDATATGTVLAGRYVGRQVTISVVLIADLDKLFACLTLEASSSTAASPSSP
jgi:hypothetical protein